MKSEGMRLGKFLADAGLASRRKVPTLFTKGKVTVNGTQIIDLSFHVNPEIDIITYNGKRLSLQRFEYYILHKPKGVVSTVKDERNRKTAVSLIKTNARIYPVGRLDADSTGLLLLTNDGKLVNKLIHPRFHVSKTYIVTIKGQLSDDNLKKFKNGIKLRDGKTQPANAYIQKQMNEKTVLEVILFEGKNRQIRRMFEYLNHPVIELKRIVMGKVKLGKLEYGKYRLLTQEELTTLEFLQS